MQGGGDLVRQAATGDVAAQMGLVDQALALGASGACRQIESLAAAETWARLAAARGGVDESRALAGVLLARSAFEVDRCSIENARWYEGEARRVLNLLVAVDDDDARATLEEMGPAPAGDHRELDVAFLNHLTAAAKGDLTALGTLCDAAFTALQTGESEPIEVLTAGELYARLGSSSGDGDQMRRLAGVLLKRAEYEYAEGWPALAHNAVAEAAVLLSILVDTGDHSMASWLSILVSGSALPAIATAARYRPSILKFIEPQGTC